MATKKQLAALRKARAARKRKHSHPKKGQASRTMKGKKDFTTKKTSKVFDEHGHYVRRDRRPYHLQPYPRT